MKDQAAIAAMPQTADPEFKHLDFSEFHDCMHLPFTHYCRQLPSGPRRHIALWWTYRAKSELRRLTLCRIGEHRWSVWRRKRPVASVFVGCTDCVKRSKRDPR